MLIAIMNYIILLVLLLIPQHLSYLMRFQASSPVSNRQHFLHARIATKNDEQSSEATNESENEKMMSIPYDGILGKDRGSLFDRPLEIYDPINNTDDLPGEDGSDEKLNAIMKRIEERVELMKNRGEWDDEESFGSNPLSNKPIIEVMLMQLKACKPFESFDDLLLTYFLMVGTTISLSAYLIFLRENFNNFMLWFTGSDFDSEFMNSIMQNISA